MVVEELETNFTRFPHHSPHKRQVAFKLGMQQNPSLETRVNRKFPPPRRVENSLTVGGSGADFYRSQYMWHAEQSKL